MKSESLLEFERFVICLILSLVFLLLALLLIKGGA